MSVQQIIETLDKLTKLHQSLLAISQEKTDVIKQGSIDELQPLLIKERQHVQALEQLEKVRQQLVESWFKDNQLADETVTITNMLEHIEDQDISARLVQTTTVLTETMTSLKRQEQLNHALIQQSMKFVELSLDMMSPSLKNLNYGKDQSQNTEAAKRSVFDSKA
ncbi:flagellar protein FlgN [Lentibacillus sp. Marseille-P4043]|uniref:flagellar protein FlgN n=1 Tax=Lentibacillus sp. Marseille-P4043 TaxID=2040293 RepID=UPI000D0B4CD1|nr:flagellar protein FlgN [Lentibacillus sp. Marseille-P4043]